MARGSHISMTACLDRSNPRRPRGGLFVRRCTMPKPMTMTIEVEEMAFGKVFRTLDGMPGVIAIKIAGTGPKKPKGNSKGNSGGRTSAQIVLAELVRQPLDKGALTQRLEEGGKKATSLP